MKISFASHGHHYLVHFLLYIIMTFIIFIILRRHGCMKYNQIILNSTTPGFIFRQFLKKHVSIILPVFVFVGWTQTDFILFFLTFWMECLPLTTEFSIQPRIEIQHERISKHQGLGTREIKHINLIQHDFVQQ